MTTESSPTDQSKISSTNVDSPGQMRGWFKLIETIRKTDPPSNDLFKSSSNIDTNGHRSKSSETINLDSPLSESPNLISSPPIISLPSTPIQSLEDIPLINLEPSIKAKDSKRRSTRHKKITIRKSTRSKEPSIINTTLDDDIILVDVHQRKRQSIDSSLNNSLTPLATDLQSLPGHNQDELRAERFLDYSDMNTLAMHLNTCLHIDKKSFSSSSLTKKHIFKTRHNILNKIFKLYYIKTYQKYFQVNQKSYFNKNLETKTNLSSSSSTSFKTDWSVNRRNIYEPKNVFHILQLNPKKQLFLSTNNKSPTHLSIENQHQINYEHMKNLLVRTYYPHFHTAFEYGYYFGTKPKMPVKHHDLPIVDNSQLISDIDQSMTITLNSPPFTSPQEFRKRGRKPKYRQITDKPLPITSTERRVSEEIPPVMIQESIIVLTPTPLIEKERNNKRKRKISITINSNINERKKKKSISLPSPEIIHESPDISYSDSDEDILPDELPKQNFITNGLRSNYYKSTSDIDSKSISTKTRLVRQRRQSSGSLPPFYTGIFENDDKLSYINYQLPFDIYWFSEKQKLRSPQPKKKKLTEPKQKQELFYRNFSRNTYTDLPIQSNLPSSNQTINTHKDLLKIEELTPHEKQILSESSIFLKRNLQRIKDKQELKDKNHTQQKQHTDEEPLPLFFSQNYHHPNLINETNNIDLSHKDLLNLFSNHIRRSYFAKTGQCLIELIDQTCYYAQLAQLTLILNEMFEFLLNYKCQNSEIYPSNALKKCPLKRLFPMYYEIILKPIDLTIIRTKLDNGDYLSYDLFEQDLLLLFHNAITYCGEDSDVGRAVKELQKYFIDILKIEYKFAINLFNNINEEKKNERNVKIFKDFITRLHQKEVINGQIRESLSDIIFNIEKNNYKTISVNTHRTIKNHCIVHCRCGSVYDETSLVQCYACQLWQHVSCVTINDYSRPYYCFECHSVCEQNSLSCLKTNVLISNDNYSSYSTITRSDGFIVRINECYFVRKQEENVTSREYDIFSIERLWIDEKNIERASGFYYLRPYETFHELNRKFFSNELFRFPSTNDSIEISSIIRPCCVLDTGTYCKGKPVSEYTSRILSTELFICEYRVDKLARTFTRLPKSKHISINTKPYCFDNYIEKISIKRDYQSHQKETPRRRPTTHTIKFTTKQLEEKSSHIDGIIEKIYCHFHHPNLIPTETKFSPNHFFQQPIIDRNNNRGSKRLREKNSSSSSSIIINKKRRTRSISSNDNITECTPDNNHHIISSLLDKLIESISSHVF